MHGSDDPGRKDRGTGRSLLRIAAVFVAVELGLLLGGYCYGYRLGFPVPPAADGQQVPRQAVVTLDGGFHACLDLQEWALVEQSFRRGDRRGGYARLRAYVGVGRCWISRRGMRVEWRTPPDGARGVILVRARASDVRKGERRAWWWIERAAALELRG